MASIVEENRKKNNVIWFINIPSPYRVDFFEELGKRVNLFVVFEKGKSDERDESWNCSCFTNFQAVTLKGRKVRTDSAFDLNVVRYLKICKQYDYVMVSNPLTILGMFIIQYCKFHGIRFYIETDGGFAKDGKGVREKVKKYFISSASGWFSTAKIHDEYYLRYGANSSNIFRYPFTSVFERKVLNKPISRSEKEILRKKIGITQEKVVLGVGQFIERKGFDTLLEISGELGNNVAVVLLGGAQTPEYSSIISKLGLNNIYFPGFVTREKIAQYYQVADVFVLPTREDIWGLVINEAAAFALPIVTTDRCIAGTELVKQGKNGYIVKPEDKDALKSAIKIILQNDQLQEKMCRESLKIAKNYTIENMVECHEQFFISRQRT